MCQKITCRTCGKATWTGCGQHVEQALAGVARADRCAGHDAPAPRTGGGDGCKRLVGRLMFGSFQARDVRLPKAKGFCKSLLAQAVL